MISGVYKIDKKKIHHEAKKHGVFCLSMATKKDADSVFVFVPEIALCNIYIIITFILYT